MVALTTLAEEMAVAAESLPAFSGVKLLHIKRSIAELLARIGSDGIFDQYTRHDISHIDAMLRSLDWIVPESSRAHLQPADWLMIVLAIYFHDLGMLVTRNEFTQRELSGFPVFCERVLFTGDVGVDYRAKINALNASERDRFLYQEFVRERHAERVKYWVQGSAKSSLGITLDVVNTIDDLLRNLDDVFRRDLGMICESHHLNDLNDFQKYKVRQPYGQLQPETANLHYCAILLRTADLLHITRDRTPSITFRILAPLDPVSQQEWVKQSAVRSIRPKIGCDQDGKLSLVAPQDTVEVHAHFKSPDGFFGLTTYLTYAENQLKLSNDWVDQARSSQGVEVTFPWRHIDSSNIETQGFLSRPFRFTLDQGRILDLLTGHTLYNDTSVVLRELLQNALDAVRLQCLISGENPQSAGRIRVGWDTVNRILTVEDNGTGMTQEIIERHLLKVGSSRYQDSEFQKKFPGFSPISRFGIGVLSCFMVADSVEVTTNHPDENLSRQLTLRSVHGQYLISLLDKVSNEDARSLGEHGTRIRLQIRPSATFDDPISVAAKWIVVPGCAISVQIDNGAPVSIGYESPGDALTAELENLGYTVEKAEGVPRDAQIQVKEFTNGGGITLAVALQWSGLFKEWAFLQYDEPPAELEEELPQIGICIEGIRVGFGSPGFDGVKILAIANATGRNTPRTNVARSSLEETPEGKALLKTIYGLYTQHVKDELHAMQSTRNFSVTWAVQEANILVDPFVSIYEYSAPLTDRALLREALRAVPLALVEFEGRRSAASVRELDSMESFWTIEGRVYDAAETLLREVPESVSLTKLVKSVSSTPLDLPNGTILCRDPLESSIQGSALTARYPVEVRIDHSIRRLHVQWGLAHEDPFWRTIVPASLKTSGRSRFSVNRLTGFMHSCVGRIAIPIHGIDGEIGIHSNGTMWLFAGTPLSGLLLKIADVLRKPLPSANAVSLLEVLTALERALRLNTRGAELANRIARAFEENEGAAEAVSSDEVIEVIEATTWKVFDPGSWTRKEAQTTIVE